jgi:hypothetical protein
MNNHNLISRKTLVACLSCSLLGGALAAADPGPNQCAGLLPDVIGAPRARSLPYGGRYSGCLRPASSRTGILAFGIGYFDLPFLADRYRLYDSRDESEVGQLDTASGVNRGLYPPTDTFQVTRQQRPYGGPVVPDPTVASWTDHGEPIAAYELDPELRDSDQSNYQTAPDVIEGGVFLAYLRVSRGMGWQLEAWRFDKLASVLFGPYVAIAGEESAPTVAFATGVDVNRNNLLLYQTDASGPVHGIWFDNGGQVLSTRDFNFNLADFGSQYRRDLTALLDGSFVIRRNPGSLRIPALDEEGDVGPAPQWIEDHPFTDLHFIRGMRGYALAPNFAYPDCEHEISVFAADGTFCGSFAPEPGTTCGFLAVYSIGLDGTVFHPTDEDVPCGTERCDCAQHYWVGLLQ